MPTVNSKLLQRIAKSNNLALVGWTNLLSLAHDLNKLKDWQELGYAGEMQYMQRDARLLSSLISLLAEAKSIISFGILYSQAKCPDCPPGFGRVARYAWGQDYHQTLKVYLSRFIAALEGELKSSFHYRIFSDSVPLLERGFASAAGLGFIGKNTMLIKPAVGSYFFLAEIISDLEIEDAALKVVDEDCGSCARCIDACPTGAIVEPFKLDARKCISYLTIEKRGSFDAKEKASLGEWVFGCDVCQEICPFNHTALKEERLPDLPEFSAVKGVGALLDLRALLKIRSATEFEQRFGNTPLTRPKREGLLRNACVVAANTGASALEPDLIVATEEDESPVVREHAMWALHSLHRNFSSMTLGQIKSVLQKRLRDPNLKVKNEALKLLEET